MTTTIERPNATETETTQISPTRRRRVLRWLGIGLIVSIAALASLVAYASNRTEQDIQAHHDRIARVGTANPSVPFQSDSLERLPEPVQRYFDYVFVEAPEPIGFVEVTMSGDFRRPLTESFAPTTAEQTFSLGTPGLMFSARTTVAPGVWARAYDAYSNGEMEMKAKIMSALTVVDESESPELNRISLRRWLLESPLYPSALLPGGPVRWEAIDGLHARAIVEADGLEASMVATFRPDGSLASFDAEEDGDLTTSYHGSGEHAERTDYRLVDGTMIPHGFTIARAAGGETFPFWTGQIDTMTIHPAD